MVNAVDYDGVTRTKLNEYTAAGQFKTIADALGIEPISDVPSGKDMDDEFHIELPNKDTLFGLRIKYLEPTQSFKDLYETGHPDFGIYGVGLYLAGMGIDTLPEINSMDANHLVLSATEEVDRQLKCLGPDDVMFEYFSNLRGDLNTLRSILVKS